MTPDVLSEFDIKNVKMGINTAIGVDKRRLLSLSLHLTDGT